MKYQIGDEIIVLLSNEEGKVVDIMNEKMVMIEVRGVKFPAYMDQIDFPYFYRFTKKKIVEPQKAPKQFVDNIPKEKPKPNQVKVATSIGFCFIPKFALDDFNDEIVELLKIHLINNSNLALGFTYTQKFAGVDNFELDNQINAFQDFYLHVLTLQQ